MAIIYLDGKWRTTINQHGGTGMGDHTAPNTIRASGLEIGGVLVQGVSDDGFDGEEKWMRQLLEHVSSSIPIRQIEHDRSMTGIETLSGVPNQWGEKLPAIKGGTAWLCLGIREQRKVLRELQKRRSEHGIIWGIPRLQWSHWHGGNAFAKRLKGLASITHLRFNVDEIVTPSHVAAETVRRVAPNLNCTVIPPNAGHIEDDDKEKRKRDLFEQYGIHEDAKVGLHIGRTTPARRPEMALDLLTYAIKKGQLDHIILAWPDKENSPLEEWSDHWRSEAIKKLESLEIPHTVIGHLDEPADVYSASAITIMPFIDSRGALDPPLTILEAKANGCHVISSNVGSMHYQDKDPLLSLVHPEAPVEEWKRKVSDHLDGGGDQSQDKNDNQNYPSRKMSLWSPLTPTELLVFIFAAASCIFLSIRANSYVAIAIAWAAPMPILVHRSIEDDWIQAPTSQVYAVLCGWCLLLPITLQICLPFGPHDSLLHLSYSMSILQGEGLTMGFWEDSWIPKNAYHLYAGGFHSLLSIFHPADLSPRTAWLLWSVLGTASVVTIGILFTTLIAKSMPTHRTVIALVLVLSSFTLWTWSVWSPSIAALILILICVLAWHDMDTLEMWNAWWIVPPICALIITHPIWSGFVLIWVGSTLVGSVFTNLRNSSNGRKQNKHHRRRTQKWVLFFFALALLGFFLWPLVETNIQIPQFKQSVQRIFHTFFSVPPHYYSLLRRIEVALIVALIITIMINIQKNGIKRKTSSGLVSLVLLSPIFLVTTMSLWMDRLLLAVGLAILLDLGRMEENVTREEKSLKIRKKYAILAVCVFAVFQIAHVSQYLENGDPWTKHELDSFENVIDPIQDGFVVYDKDSNPHADETLEKHLKLYSVDDKLELLPIGEWRDTDSGVQNIAYNQPHIPSHLKEGYYLRSNDRLGHDTTANWSAILAREGDFEMYLWSERLLA